MSELMTWDQLLGEIDGGADLLLGNGFSISLCESFRYESLLGEAELDSADRRAFSLARTANFEVALDLIRKSEELCTLRRHPPTEPMGSDRIQLGLVEALRRVHPLTPSRFRLGRIADMFEGFGRVFTTNYDLLTYWVCMERPGVLKDLMWNSCPECGFDPGDTEVRSGTPVYFLHGGLQLESDPITGRVRKIVNQGESILEQVRQPHIVVEVDGDAKMYAINQSPYLAHAFSEFRRPVHLDAPLVTLGYAFGDSDGHILDASAGRRMVYAAVYRGELDLDALRKQLPNVNVIGWDAETAPDWREPNA